MSTWTQKRIYHSMLKAKSPLVVRWHGDPMPSKFDDKDIVYFDVRNDEDGEYYYVIDSPEIATAIVDAPKEEWVKITAMGGKDAQTLIIDGQVSAGSVASAPADTTYSTGHISGNFQRCLEEARGIAITLLDSEDPVIIKEIATTLFIQWSYTKYRTPLNADDVESVTAVEEDKSAEYEAELRGLLEQLPKTSGKAHDGRALKTTIAKFEEALDGEIDAELFARMWKWLDAEITHQEEAAEELPPDELPF